MTTSSDGGARGPRAAAPGPAELLRATLEKIVFFEWRVSELAAELAAAQGRAAAAEQERALALEQNHQARRETHAARHQLTELEAERARLATLLARPAHGQVDGAALEAERERTAQLEAELSDARREVQRQKDERARWLQEMIDQAREGDEAPAALAQFISELRSEVISLRDRQSQCDLLLLQAGVTPPLAALPEPLKTAPHRQPDAVETARRLWNEGRLEVPLGSERAGASVGPRGMPAGDSALPRLSAASTTPAGTDLLPGLAALRASPAVATRVAAPRALQSAHRALADQCLRGLVAHDPARRAQAARHLAALPVPAAAPGLAAALGRETDPRARAAIARALAACGGDEAAGMVLRLLSPDEPTLVRLAALDALAVPDGRCCRAALEAAASDPAPAVRRRAASLALSSGGADDLVARLFADPDSSVRAAAGGGDHVPEAPLAPDDSAPAPLADAVPRALELQRDPEAPRDLQAEALHAVRAALFGLTEAELAEAIGLAPSEGPALAQSLLGQGLLARRGRRLVAAAAEPQQAERGG